MPKGKPEAGPAASAGPQIRRHETWLPVPGYEGFELKLWVNHDQALRADLYTADTERVEAALKAIVLEHNGWRDYRGQPYPPASDPGFWEAIPTELAAVAIRVAKSCPFVFPNSLDPRKISSD